MSAYQSGEFLIPGGPSSNAPPAVAVFGGKLWVVGGASNQMTVTTLDLIDDDGVAIDIESGAATASGNWTTQPFSLPGGGGPWQTTSRCSIAVAGDGMYLCWNSVGEGGALRAAKYSTSGDGTPGWQWVTTLVAAGDTEKSGLVAGHGACVSAIGFGDGTVIIACPLVSAWWAPGPQTFYIGTFDESDVSTGSASWQARSDIWGMSPVLPPFGQGYTFPNFGTAISMDWLIAAAPGSPSAPQATPTEGTPPFQLTVSLEPGSPSLPPTLVLPVDTTGDVTYGDSPAGWPASLGDITVRDPAGRLRSYRADTTQGQIAVNTSTTWSAPDPTTPTPFPVAASELGAPGATTGGPSVAFFTDMTHPTTQTLNGQSGSAYPVYELIVYGDNHLCCQVNRFGTAEVYPDYGLVSPLKPKVPGTIVISGIVDGPIPVPNVNIASYAFQDTQPTFGEIVYGLTTSASNQHSVTNSWTAGFKSDAQTTKGWGIAWDISLSGGMGYVRTDGTSTTSSNLKTAPSVLDTSTAIGSQAVLPVGHVFGAEAVFQWTAYRFFDNEGDPIADGSDATLPQQAPLYTTVTCVFTDGQVETFVPYAVTPGDLSTYTVEAWDQRMTQLGYSGSYVEEVIEPNAYRFAGGLPYLTAAWDNGGGTTSGSFGHTSTTFTETSWTIDSSIYVGVSGGIEVDSPILGLGEAWSYEFLVGGTYTHDAMTSTGTSQEWQIGLAEGWGDLGTADDPSMIAHYSFRIYFLPPPPTEPNKWVTELQAALRNPLAPTGPRQLDPEIIDPNAAAWKIVFVVDSYESVDGTIRYPPNSPPT